MKIPNKVYDILKWLVLIVIPALTTFYATVVIDGLPVLHLYPAISNPLRGTPRAP